jgi:hypothetical protein
MIANLAKAQGYLNKKDVSKARLEFKFWSATARAQLSPLMRNKSVGESGCQDNRTPKASPILVVQINKFLFAQSSIVCL